LCWVPPQYKIAYARSRPLHRLKGAAAFATTVNIGESIGSVAKILQSSSKRGRVGQSGQERVNF
jgi:hypothetical protein